MKLLVDCWKYRIYIKKCFHQILRIQSSYEGLTSSCLGWNVDKWLHPSTNSIPYPQRRAWNFRKLPTVVQPGTWVRPRLRNAIEKCKCILFSSNWWYLSHTSRLTFLGLMRVACKKNVPKIRNTLIRKPWKNSSLAPRITSDPDPLASNHSFGTRREVT